MLTQDLYADFIAARKPGWAPGTLVFYQKRLKKFVAAFGAREFAGLRVREIMEYLDAAGANASDSTRRHNIVAFEQLQQFALHQGVIERKLVAKLDKPAVAKRERLPTDEETRKLLARASPEFRLIYAALRQCGARPGELCRASWADVQTENGERKIVLKRHKTAKKTGKDRVIPLGRKLAKLVEEAGKGRTDGPIFRSPAGRAWTVENLSKTYSRLRDAAGLPRDLVLYLARHEHGSKICAEKGIHAAASALGHSSITTTQRYVHPSVEELRVNQDLFDAGDVPAAEEPPAAGELRPAA